MAKRTSAAKMEEQNDLESEPTPPKEMDLAGGLAFVTFAALLVGIVLAQLAMKKYFGTGLLA
ncbi:MAG: hypothetical protein JNL90_17875 [Planctomycetes bacterium]|nr:hypothetical protein [Planctomycetota bacterium]